MPSREITYEGARASLNSAESGAASDDSSQSNLLYSKVIATKQGLALLEIQGELNLPPKKPEGLTLEESGLFTEEQIPQKYTEMDHRPVDLVKFGRLEVDEQTKNAVLYVSSSQRLVGKLEAIDPPLGVMRISKEGNESVALLDVIKKRVVFRNRPLPIM